MGNKVRLITPFLMLSAGAIASIIMYIRGYEFERMLWILLIVLLIFYVIGDIVRYLYASIRPRIIPDENIGTVVMGSFNEGKGGIAFAEAEDDSAEAGENTYSSEDGDEEYSDEALAEYEDSQARNGGMDGDYDSEEYEEAYMDGN